MWETIKNDPLLKSITILVLGVLSFGLAFNIMFGRSNGGMENGMGGGYSLDNTLAYILSISMKLLFIGLVIAALVVLIRVAKRYLIEGDEVKMFGSIKNSINTDPVLKVVLVAIASVIALGLLAAMVSPMLGSYNGYGMMTYGYYSGMGNIAVIVGKLLLYISIIGLLVSVIAYIKQNKVSIDIKKMIPASMSKELGVRCDACNHVSDKAYKFCPSCGKQQIQECIHCGTALKDVWKCCPNCAAEINTVEEIIVAENGIDTVELEINAAIEEKVINTEESIILAEKVEGTDLADEIINKLSTSGLSDSNSKHENSHQRKQKRQR